MPRLFGLVAAAIVAFPLVFASPLAVRAVEESGDVKALLRHVDKLWRGESSHGRMTMVVKTERYERTMSLEAWSEGTTKSLVVIRAPKKDEGVATLKVDQNIWNYLPKINRVAKVPPSMMMGSWMGSHFTNDDLVKESSYVDDYDAEITFRGERGGRRVIEVTLRPKPEAAVVWGKVVMDIEQESLAPVKMDYYDEDQELARTMTYSEPKPLGGRLVPRRMELRPQDKPDESTVVSYDSLEFDMKLPADLFSLQRLQSVR